MWRVAIAALLLIFALAACATPPAPLVLPAPAETSSPPETSPPTVNTGELGVTLPITQPLPSLVILDAGVITVTQTVTGADEPVEVLLPAQGAFAMPVWAANGDHQQPLAVILADADRVCEANEAEQARWTLMKSVELRGRGQMTQIARPIRPTLADRS